jgi:transcriptional regulator with XRE-family HTH domain
VKRGANARFLPISWANQEKKGDCAILATLRLGGDRTRSVSRVDPGLKDAVRGSGLGDSNVRFVMDAAELKKWRKTLCLTQSEAAEKLGVGRTAFQNWELGYFPIPHTTKLACETITKCWKQRSDFGPVTLVYTDRPIWPTVESKHETRVLHCEFHDNNESALARGRLVASESMLHNLAILDSDGEVVWSTPELSREFRTDAPLSNVQDDARHAAGRGSKPTVWWELLYGTELVSGRQVKAARALLGWSQADLARASGVSVATIVQLEAAPGNDSIHSKTAGKVRYAIELAGIDFIEERGGRGIRLRVES